MTLHNTFALPINQFGGVMPKLSDDIASTVRAKLNDWGDLIIDEISMAGCHTIDRVNTRAIQITGVDKPFGGKSVIVVGDLYQLPPVMDRPVFMTPNGDDLSVLAGHKSCDKKMKKSS